MGEGRGGGGGGCRDRHPTSAQPSVTRARSWERGWQGGGCEEHVLTLQDSASVHTRQNPFSHNAGGRVSGFKPSLPQPGSLFSRVCGWDPPPWVAEKTRRGAGTWKSTGRTESAGGTAAAADVSSRAGDRKPQVPRSRSSGPSGERMRRREGRGPHHRPRSARCGVNGTVRGSGEGLFCLVLAFVFLGPHLQHTEVSRLGV